MNGITLITPTGGREESLKRCIGYISRFVKPIDVPIQWIIVDDFIHDRIYDVQVNGIRTEIVKPSHVWRHGINTQAQNLLAACNHVQYEHIIFIEDDDWYGPHHLMNIHHGLLTADIVGENPARYYHVPSRSYRVMQNTIHASLCQTGMRSSILDKFIYVCRNHMNLIDWNFWQTTNKYDFLQTKNCVGMKGLPGRPGIGVGHRPERNPHNWTIDSDLSVLKEWIGEDVSLYY